MLHGQAGVLLADAGCLGLNRSARQACWLDQPKSWSRSTPPTCPCPNSIAERFRSMRSCLPQRCHKLVRDREGGIGVCSGDFSERARAIPTELAFQLLHFRVLCHVRLFCSVRMNRNGPWWVAYAPLHCTISCVSLADGPHTLRICLLDPRRLLMLFICSLSMR